MMRKVTTSDIPAWLKLAAEAEPLFGSMVNEESFHGAMDACILSESALCLVTGNNIPAGIIAIDRSANEILWFVVGQEHRGKGYGKELLETALTELDKTRPVYVQTFAPGIQEGGNARALYSHRGFRDHKEGGLNPAGLDTVIMVKE
jgi:GNAT superfamily N-acetyltransferase